MYEIRPIRFLLVLVMYTKRQRGLDTCTTDSKKPPLFSQASLTKVQTIWAMIGKLLEVTPDGASEEQHERPHRCSHMAYTSHQAPERTHHPSFHCSAPCSYPLWAVTLCSPCLEFRASLRSSHSTQQQSSEQDTTIQACTAKVNLGKGTWKIPPPCLTGRSACGDLDWPVGLTFPQG